MWEVTTSAAAIRIIAKEVLGGLSAGLTHYGQWGVLVRDMCGVEVWRGGLGGAYPLPTLSSVGASLAPPCFCFHTPLIEPDMRISRFRLSEKGSRCRPRESARPFGKADETQHVVQGGLGKPLGP